MRRILLIGLVAIGLLVGAGTFATFTSPTWDGTADGVFVDEQPTGDILTLERSIWQPGDGSFAVSGDMSTVVDGNQLRIEDASGGVLSKTFAGGTHIGPIGTAAVGSLEYWQAGATSSEWRIIWADNRDIAGIDDEAIYNLINVGSDDWAVHAVAPDNDRIMTSGSQKVYSYKDVVMADEYIVISSDDTVYAFDKDDGSKKRFYTQTQNAFGPDFNDIDGTMTAHGDMVYAIHRSYGDFEAMDLSGPEDNSVEGWTKSFDESYIFRSIKANDDGLYTLRMTDSGSDETAWLRKYTHDGTQVFETKLAEGLSWSDVEMAATDSRVWVKHDDTVEVYDDETKAGEFTTSRTMLDGGASRVLFDDGFVAQPAENHVALSGTITVDEQRTVQGSVVKDTNGELVITVDGEERKRVAPPDGSTYGYSFSLSPGTHNVSIAWDGSCLTPCLGDNAFKSLRIVEPEGTYTETLTVENDTEWVNATTKDVDIPAGTNVSLTVSPVNGTDRTFDVSEGTNTYSLDGLSTTEVNVTLELTSDSNTLVTPTVGGLEVRSEQPPSVVDRITGGIVSRPGTSVGVGLVAMLGLGWLLIRL